MAVVRDPPHARSLYRVPGQEGWLSGPDHQSQEEDVSLVCLSKLPQEGKEKRSESLTPTPLHSHGAVPSPAHLTLSSASHTTEPP